MRERGAYIYIIYLFININIYVENARSEERRGCELGGIKRKRSFLFRSDKLCKVSYRVWVELRSEPPLNCDLHSFCFVRT